MILQYLNSDESVLIFKSLQRRFSRSIIHTTPKVRTGFYFSPCFSIIFSIIPYQALLNSFPSLDTHRQREEKKKAKPLPPKLNQTNSKNPKAAKSYQPNKTKANEINPKPNNQEKGEFASFRTRSVKRSMTFIFSQRLEYCPSSLGPPTAVTQHPPAARARGAALPGGGGSAAAPELPRRGGATHARPRLFVTRLIRRGRRRRDSAFVGRRRVGTSAARAGAGAPRRPHEPPVGSVPPHPCAPGARGWLVLASPFPFFFFFFLQSIFVYFAIKPWCWGR